MAPALSLLAALEVCYWCQVVAGSAVWWPSVFSEKWVR